MGKMGNIKKLFFICKRIAELGNNFLEVDHTNELIEMHGEK
jgi:hypothetical protein